MSHSIYTHRSDKRLREKDSVAKLSENGIGDLVLHLHFSYSVILPNLDILRSESLPKSVPSFSPNNLVEQNLTIWQPVWRLEKIGVLRIYPQ